MPFRNPLPAMESRDDEKSEGGIGLLWVPETLLADLTASLERKEDISKAEQLIDAGVPEDAAIMVPVDI